jgi:hypothetical protein
MPILSLIKCPSAFLPLVLSFGALAAVLLQVGILATDVELDARAPGHLWQWLVLGQLPLIAFFALKWLPRDPRSAGLVLALQGTLVLSAVWPVYWLHL